MWVFILSSDRQLCQPWSSALIPRNWCHLLWTHSSVSLLPLSLFVVCYPVLVFLPSPTQLSGFFSSVFFSFIFDFFFLLPSLFLLSSLSYFRTWCYGSHLFSCQRFNPHQRSHQLKSDPILTAKPPPKLSDVVMQGSDTFSFWEGAKWEREEGIADRVS